MYRRPKFLEKLIEIRQVMAQEADYDVDLFAEMTRSGAAARHRARRMAASKNGVGVLRQKAEKAKK